MLTTEDRRWLTGEKVYGGEHAKQQRYQRRRDNRDRVTNALLDFSTLFEHLEEGEREKIFDPVGESSEAGVELSAGITDAFAFLLYSTGITGAMGETTRTTPRSTVAERLLRDGVDRAAHREELVIRDFALKIDAAQARSEDLLQTLLDGEDLTPAERRYLLESGRIDEADI